MILAIQIVVGVLIVKILYRLRSLVRTLKLVTDYFGTAVSTTQNGLELHDCGLSIVLHLKLGTT